MYERSKLALRLESVFTKKAKERMLSGTPVPKSEQGRTIVKVGEIAGVGKDTIHKVKTIEEKAPEEIKQKLRDDKMSINEAYRKVRKEASNTRGRRRRLPEEKKIMGKKVPHLKEQLKSYPINIRYQIAQ